MVDNEPFAKGASKKLSVHIPAFFFLFGGRGGRQGNIKMRHRCELACSPRGGYYDFKWQGWLNGDKIKTQLSLNQKLTTKKTHAKFPSPKNLQEEKKVWLHLIWLCFITTPPPPPPPPPTTKPPVCRCFLWVGKCFCLCTLEPYMLKLGVTITTIYFLEPPYSSVEKSTAIWGYKQASKQAAFTHPNKHLIHCSPKRLLPKKIFWEPFRLLLK